MSVGHRSQLGKAEVELGAREVGYSVKGREVEHVGLEGERSDRTLEGVHSGRA